MTNFLWGSGGIASVSGACHFNFAEGENEEIYTSKCRALVVNFIGRLRYWTEVVEYFKFK